MNVDLEVTGVYEKNLDAYIQGWRYIANQGGTRSSKTYSILQLIFTLCFNDTGKKYSIVRKTLPSLKSSVLQDWLEILNNTGAINEVKFNKTELIFEVNGNTVEFFSLDSEQKVRGSKRDILFCNEANELGYEDFLQLDMRTTEVIFIDYNPSATQHWIYTKILEDQDCKLLKSTFLDNPFVPQATVDMLMKMKEQDPERFRVWGEGERGIGSDNIFPIFHTYTKLPEDVDTIGYGLDFGFTNDPSALVKGYKKNNDIYLEELIYKSGLTNKDISNHLIRLGVGKSDLIYADSSEPKSIEELKRLGWTVRPTKKGKDSILAGIGAMKDYNLYIKGTNINDEFINYKWKKDRNDELTNTPIDKYNHIIDAARYLIYMTQTNPRFGSYTIV